MRTRNLKITTHSLEETWRLGERLGAGIREKVVLTLDGDLGSGKTAFVQGLARGLETPPECYVTSPSYTLINQYPGRLPLYHVDLYRLDGPGDFEDVGLYEILEDPGVVAIEWAERLPKNLLTRWLAVRIDMTGEQRRRFRFRARGQNCIDLLDAIEHPD
ncbi:MAG: tRNA (adenosine(37)-N6)-threonylcarbamoyltransferase complex ATPase subunit type 1 TsaE [Desulfobacterales bacterium]|nr:tRNA (adenosine(37)-N6)-threonylcarbamoyltransferase complex ATPase subunit type 1 TsaE [Desulfobacterales bacterium]